MQLLYAPRLLIELFAPVIHLMRRSIQLVQQLLLCHQLAHILLYVVHCHLDLGAGDAYPVNGLLPHQAVYVLPHLLIVSHPSFF